VRHIAQGTGRQAQQVHRQSNAQNGHQRRRRGTGQARQQVDNGHRCGHQPDHHVQRHAAEPGVAVLEVIQLRQGNHDRQAVDEPQHHRVRHHAHQFAQFEQAERQHDQPAQQHRSQQVLHTVLHHQRDDHHRHRPGGTGDHAWPPAKQRGKRANNKGAIQAHQRVEMGNQRERDALGQQGKRRREPGQDISAQT